MLTIFEAMMATVRDYVGKVETASLSKYESGKPYTRDCIQIDGVTEEGRRFSLDITVENKENDS